MTGDQFYYYAMQQQAQQGYGQFGGGTPWNQTATSSGTPYIQVRYNTTATASPSASPASPNQEWLDRRVNEMRVRL